PRQPLAAPYAAASIGLFPMTTFAVMFRSTSAFSAWIFDIAAGTPEVLTFTLASWPLVAVLISRRTPEVLALTFTWAFRPLVAARIFCLKLSRSGSTATLAFRPLV